MENKKRIIVADVGEEFRALLVAGLREEADLEVVAETGDGQDAVRLVRELSPDVLIMDLMLTRMDGMEVLEELFRRGWTRELPVFLITAESANSTLRRAYELGVMDVISKPVVPYIVERRIDSVIELFRARRRLRQRVEEQQSEILRQAGQIIELNMGMIEALSTAIEFRSGESGSHVRRIHDITRYLLEHTELGAGFSQEEITQILRAGMTAPSARNARPWRFIVVDQRPLMEEMRKVHPYSSPL